MHDEHSQLRVLLSEEARGVGIEASSEWITNAVSSLLRLYEKGRDAWMSNKQDTIGHVYEMELPSGTTLLMGSRQILTQIQ